MTKAKSAVPVPASDKPRITFTITGHYDLDGIDAADCVDNFREAMEKLRECGDASGRISVPAHTEEL